MCRHVRSRHFKNEETMACVGQQHHREKDLYLSAADALEIYSCIICKGLNNIQKSLVVVPQYSVYFLELRKLSHMDEGKIPLMKLCTYFQTPEACGFIPINISQILKNKCPVYSKSGKGKRPLGIPICRSHENIKWILNI